MIKYLASVENISIEMIRDGFFDGWSNPPSKEIHLQILQKSNYVVLAIDEYTEDIIGFINAITDGVLCAYVPLLEVLPKYRNQGIGDQLVSRLLDQLSDYYMIDLSCNENLQAFYEHHDMVPSLAMIKRNYRLQSGSYQNS